MRVSILAIDGVFDTGLAALLDVFRLANNLSLRERGVAPFDVSLVGVRRKVLSAQGFGIPVQAIASEGPPPDWAVLPAQGTGDPATLVPALLRADARNASAQLVAWHAQGARLASACNGSLLLAETGLLDGREATISWWLAPLFRQRYPKVLLDESRMLVPTDVGVTAGAAMGHLDLALWLVRQASPELATVVARYLLADIRSLQAPYIIPNHLAHADPLIVGFERWARGNLKKGFSLKDAADALATSSRTLQRRCEAVLGKSPLSYFQDLRVERARSLLHGSDLDIEAIATEVGYVDGATLRTLLRQKLGRGVRDLRADLH
jgi:transcriptional regulator GlxA family with amidase domain